MIRARGIRLRKEERQYPNTPVGEEQIKRDHSIRMLESGGKPAGVDFGS